MDTLIAFGAFCGFALLIFVVPSFFSWVRVIKQYQNGVLFSFGKLSKILKPGWHIIVPIMNTLSVVDMRVKAVEVEEQETITKDNVSVHVSAVIYYKVVDAAKAVVVVQNPDWAVQQLAQTTMRNVVGEVTLDELLSNRTKISEKIEALVSRTIENWGVHVESVDIKDITLPQTMKRTMAKVAEADRERKANILKSEGEVIAAENLKKAADILASSPGALHLRTLNSINDISSDQSNTVIFAVPLEILRAFEGFGLKNTVDAIVKSKNVESKN